MMSKRSIIGLIVGSAIIAIGGISLIQHIGTVTINENNVLVIGDSLKGAFEVDNVWVTLIKDLLITVIVAYFGSRGVEKYKTKSD